VSLSDLTKDAARPAQTRQSNEEAVRSLLSSDQAQKALKSANLDYQKVDKAVGQLSDEDLAKLAERSRQAQRDFAAGRISDRDLLWIDRKSTRLNSSHDQISYAVFCLKKK